MVRTLLSVTLRSLSDDTVNPDFFPATIMVLLWIFHKSDTSRFRSALSRGWLFDLLLFRLRSNFSESHFIFNIGVRTDSAPATRVYAKA